MCVTCYVLRVTDTEDGGMCQQRRSVHRTHRAEGNTEPAIMITTIDGNYGATLYYLRMYILHFCIRHLLLPWRLGVTKSSIIRHE